MVESGLHLILTNIQSFVCRYIQTEMYNMSEISGNDETASKLPWGEPKWLVWKLIQLKLSMDSEKKTKQKPSGYWLLSSPTNYARQQIAGQ